MTVGTTKAEVARLKRERLQLRRALISAVGTATTLLHLTELGPVDRGNYRLQLAMLASVAYPAPRRRA